MLSQHQDIPTTTKITGVLIINTTSSMLKVDIVLLVYFTGGMYTEHYHIDISTKLSIHSPINCMRQHLVEKLLLCTE